MVQRAVTMLLNAIYEQDFRCQLWVSSRKACPCRGRRPDFSRQYGKWGDVVEADIQGFFDNIDHDWFLTLLARRIDDKAFRNLIRKWLKAGMLEPDGNISPPDTGTPQGGLVSPVLANVS